jgi:hypothetical protein
MGRAIFYCGVCSTRVYEEAILHGTAFKHGDRVLCTACAPSVGLTPPTPGKIPLRSSSTSVRRVPAPTPKEPLPAAPEEETDEPPPPRRGRLLLAAGAGLAVLIAAGALLLGRGKAEVPADPTDAGLPATEAPPEKTGASRPLAPRRPEAEALERAREYARRNPADLTGQIREFEKVRWAFESSREAQQAGAEVDALRAKLKEIVEATLAEVEKEIRGPLDGRRYDEAIRILEAAQGRLDIPEWTLALGRLLREVRESGRRAEGEATPAPPPEAGGAKPPVAALPAETKPRTEEGKAYLARWERAAALAAARDFAGARAELQRDASAWKEEETLAELARDAKDFRDLEALHGRLFEAAGASMRGGVSLQTLEGKTVSGVVLRSDAFRVELSQGGRKPTAFVEWSDVSAASLSALARGARPDPRSLALLLLVEGDLEGARAALGAKPEAVPAKYWAYAPGAKARLPRPERRELDARELFYAAEREFRLMETRGPACEKYRTLQNDYAATALVRSAAERIQRRSDACREYFLAGPDFRFEGSFRPRPDGRLETREEMSENYANRNWVELEFFALPETPYRCWVLLGGCCQENFVFWLQGTEMTDIDPKTRKKVAVEPGGRFGSPGKHSIRGLKPTHAACSPKKEPKQASRWEWAEIPLPKYASGGLKRLRLLTYERGFGLGAAVVSGTRKAPPPEAEVRELERSRVAEAEAPPPDPDLVAHWTLDEGSANAAHDASGNGHHGTVSGAPQWGEGKSGGALVLNGKDAQVTVPDAPALRIKGDITLAFWVRKDGEIADWQRLVGKGDSSRRTYGVWYYNGKLLWQHYNDAGGAVLDLHGTAVLEAGRWYHVACVVSGTQAAIYVDGKQDVAGTRTGEPAVSSDAPLTMGHAGYHSFFPGALDDVRLYRRALSAEEIQSLHALGR